jgi:phosphoribosylformimino-5-aminoimidazole carboxamide ribonucleotide (ProFAR) isomerase
MDKLHLVPVIHLEEGQALIENKKKGERFFTDPVDLAVELDELGFDEILIIDDDGDKKGEFTAFELLYEIAEYTQIELIVKGGFRNFDSISKAFDAGASRVMLTSMSIEDPEMLTQLIDAYGSNSFIIAMELMGDSLVYHHHKDKSEMLIESVISLYKGLGIDRFSIQLLDDLGRKLNPDLDFLDKVMAVFPRIRLYAGEGLNKASLFQEFENIGLSGMFLGDEFYTDEALFRGMKEYRNE